MKTSDSSSEQKKTNSSDTSTGKVQENPSAEELRIVDEKNMVGQPMGNHIQNSNFKHQTPADQTNKQNFSEGDSNSMKKQQQEENPSIDVIQSLKNSSGKSQGN